MPSHPHAERLRSSGCPRPEQAGRLADEKEQMLAELQRLERDMQNAARDLASTQRAASARVREALGEMQQDELALRLRAGAEYLRQGVLAPLATREGVITAGLDQLRDQLQAARGMVDRGTPEQGQLEQGLAQIEQLRGQLRSGAIDRGRAVGVLNGILRGWYLADHGSSRAVEDVIREVETHPTQALAALEQLELLLRRKIQENQSDKARSGAGDRIPAGYSDAVAEYFRRLSSGK